MSKWEWRIPRGHEGQTWFSWQVEQLAAMLLWWVGTRAPKRGDFKTAFRVKAIIDEGARQEQLDQPPRNHK